MEDELGWIERSALEYWNEIVEGFAAVDHDRFDVRGVLFVEALDVIELRVEDFTLNVCGGFFVMVVKTQFAPRDALWISHDRAESVPHVRAIIGIERMNTRRAPDVCVRLCHRQDTHRLLRCRADCDAARDTMLAGFAERGVHTAGVLVWRKVWKGEVAVGVDHA